MSNIASASATARRDSPPPRFPTDTIYTLRVRSATFMWFPPTANFPWPRPIRSTKRAYPRPLSRRGRFSTARAINWWRSAKVPSDSIAAPSLQFVVQEQGVARFKFPRQVRVVQLSGPVEGLFFPRNGLEKIAVGGVTARQSVHVAGILIGGGVASAGGQLHGHFGAAHFGVGGRGVKQRQVVQRGRIVRCQDEGLAVVVDGFAVFAQFLFSHGELELGRGLIGVFGNGANEARFG